MAENIDGKKVAFLVANEGVEQVELTRPWDAISQAGAETVLIAPEAGEVQAFEHLDKADTFEATVAVGDADPGDYDALVLPGGVANPDQLRTVDEAVAFVRRLLRRGKAGGCDLPRAVDAGRGRRRPRPHADLVAEPEDRYPERRG